MIIKCDLIPPYSLDIRGMVGQVCRELEQTVMTQCKIFQALQTEQCFSTEILNTVVVEMEVE